jgi:sugar transferase (PEP-CTERM/EpsH1 system associated)
MRILLITDRLPYPILSGNQLRLHNLLSRIARQHEVWLATFLDAPEEVEGLRHVRQFCRQIAAVKLKHSHKANHLPRVLRYGATGKPWQLAVYHSDDLINGIRAFSSSVDFDLVQIEHSHMALYLEAVPLSLRPRSLLTFYDVQFEQSRRIAQIERSVIRKMRAWLHSWMMLRWEPAYAQKFSRCIVMSECDRRLLLRANPALTVDVVPNGVDSQALQPLGQVASRPSLLFVGSLNYSPNIDAVSHFCLNTLPLIRARIGAVDMWIVGSDPPPEIVGLNGNGVHVVGQVRDVVPYYGLSSVCVVPLRAGGGTRLKVLEAMALGRPVVSTSLGCEGLDVVDGENVLLADCPQQFAMQIARLLTNPTLLGNVVNNARELVVRRYDWDRIAARQMQIYEALLARPESPPQCLRRESTLVREGAR